MKLLAAGASLLALSLSTQAFAQDAAQAEDKSPNIEEIVVTAQFRAQNLDRKSVV